MIAPFAFLGPEYDKVLEEVYTTISPEDVARPRSIIAAIQNDGMADNEPLWALISKYVDERLLAAIAAEHEKGRILLIGTTDLDARQPVIWNVGNIAASGSSNALELFRSILLASAAIPGAFPPTLVDVEVDGKRVSRDARRRGRFLASTCCDCSWTRVQRFIPGLGLPRPVSFHLEGQRPAQHGPHDDQ